MSCNALMTPRSAAGLVGGLCTALLLGASGAALADNFPNTRVVMVVPFPAGGASDAVGRYLAEPLSKALGQTVVVDNVGGGAGTIGAAKVTREKPDGYTIMLGSVNETVLTPLTNPAVRYNYADFTPLAKVGSSAFMVVGRKGLPANSLDEVINTVRKQPGSLTFGSPGVGSYQQVVMESIQQLTGTSMLHVPYRGGAPMLTDLLGGQIDLGVGLPTMLLPHIRQQSVKAYGVTGEQRDASAPELPSINESQSISGVDYVFWFGVFAPKGLPEARRQRLQQAVVEVLADPTLREQLKQAGLTVATPQEQQDFPTFLVREHEKLSAVASKIKFD